MAAGGGRFIERTVDVEKVLRRREGTPYVYLEGRDFVGDTAVEGVTGASCVVDALLPGYVDVGSLRLVGVRRFCERVSTSDGCVKLAARAERATAL